MLERLVIAVLIAALVAVVYGLFRRRQIQRVARQGSADPLLQGARPGVPTIVYFTTPNCAPCRYQQKPALVKLQEELGDGIQIIEVDAADQPDDAKRWGVFTAPTTFILNAEGKPCTVNHGVADARKLAQQVRDAQARCDGTGLTTKVA
ncbi:MAG: thioredoxin family protein [Anaerolineae bacterium]